MAEDPKPDRPQPEGLLAPGDVCYVTYYVASIPCGVHPWGCEKCVRNPWREHNRMIRAQEEARRN